jgi:surface protein
MGSLIQNTIFGRSKNSFVSTWRTSNTSTGSSTSMQVKLPLVSSGTYNFIVDWGDGSSNKITVWNQAQVTHTYAVAGDYTIKINGTCTGWQFLNIGDRLKILSVQSWGKLKLGTSSFNHFQGCSNLNLSNVSDILDLSGTTSISGLFAGCSSLTTIGRVSEWNVSAITNMSSLFSGATAFNQNLGSWDVSAVTNFSNMFSSASFNNGGSNTINNWTINTTSVVLMNGMFGGASVFNQPIGSWNTSKVSNMSQMFFNAAVFNQPIGSWNTSAVTNMSQMFQAAFKFDQNIGSWNVSNVVNFSNMFRGATVFNNGGNSNINNWTINTISNVSFDSMFYSALAFNQNIGAWNVSNVSTFNQMFQSATKFNNGESSDINNWNLRTSGTIVTNMFNGASSFNQPLRNWNVSSVTNMTGMFQYATVFNQNIGAWSTINTTNMSLMFNGARDFNNGGSSTINNWNTGNVVTTQRMFSKDNAANVVMTFNQPVGNWDMSKNTNMSYMFGAFQGTAATSFNQDIGSWNVSLCTNFSGMFNLCSLFNNGGSSTINNWILKDTGTIDMSNMFRYATSFNQDIGSWNVSRVTNMSYMFYNATVFNNGGSATINNWDTGNVTNMAGMFFWLSGPVPAFNKPIGNWNTANVTNMNGMFGTNHGTFSSPFNQNIGAWNISNVTDFGNFMQNKKVANFSTANLDAIYNGWSTRPVKTPITITFGAAKYTSASSAGRAILTASPNNWTITDGGL